MSELVKIAGLWRNERDGKVTLSGPLGPNVRVVITKNKYKRGDRDPDYVLFVTSAERKNQGQGQSQRQGAPAERQEPARQPEQAPSPQDDIPF